MEKTFEEMVHAAPVELYNNTNNIETAITNVFDYQTREEMSFEVQDAFNAVMAEVYDMRRTLKVLLTDANNKRVAKLTGKDHRFPDRQ